MTPAWVRIIVVLATAAASENSCSTLEGCAKLDEIGDTSLLSPSSDTEVEDESVKQVVSLLQGRLKIRASDEMSGETVGLLADSHVATLVVPGGGNLVVSDSHPGNFKAPGEYFGFGTANGEYVFRTTEFDAKTYTVVAKGRTGTITVWRDNDNCKMSCGRWTDSHRAGDWVAGDTLTLALVVTDSHPGNYRSGGEYFGFDTDNGDEFFGPWEDWDSRKFTVSANGKIANISVWRDADACKMSCGRWSDSPQAGDWKVGNILTMKNAGLVVSHSHPGNYKDPGQYFGFGTATGDDFFGNKDWDHGTFTVAANGRRFGKARFWRDNDICQMSCGRWSESPQAGDWSVGDTIVLKLVGLVVSDSHPGSFASPGQYFGFEDADADDVFGTTDWDKKQFKVSANGRTGKVKLWRDNDKCQMSCGRWSESAQAGDWSIGDTLMLQVAGLVVSDNHPGTFASPGEYFGFENADADDLFGTADWHGKQFTVSANGKTGKVKLWRDNDKCQMSCGRWSESAQSGDWSAGDVLMLEEASLVVSDSHPGNYKAPGEYFGFENADADDVFGTAEWGGKEFIVSANGKTGKVELFRDNDQCKMSCGRWSESPQAGDWSVGDTLTLEEAPSAL